MSAGRADAAITRLRMRPMSLAASGHSNGAVSMAALFEGAIPRAPDPGVGIKDIVERIDYHTVIDSIAALTRVFIVEDLPAWSPALRSRGSLRSAPKRHFVDPSLAAAAIDAGPDRLLRDPEKLGLLFESLVIRDLRIYSEAIRATVAHYREASGSEVDAVLQRRDGTWAAVEIKLGQGQVDAAAASLLRMADHVDQGRHGPPAFLAVITGWGYAYRRPDGVHVVPWVCSAPDDLAAVPEPSRRPAPVSPWRTRRARPPSGRPFRARSGCPAQAGR